MKKIFLFLLMVIIPSVFALQSGIYNDNQLRVDLLRYNPSLVQPGEDFNVWFNVINIGTEEIDNFDIIFSGGFPFSIYQGNDTVHLDKLKAGESKEISYNVLINRNALEGNNSFTLQYYSKKFGTTFGQTFKINIQRVRLFSEVKFIVEPEEISPGSSGKIKFIINNPLKSVIKDITIKLNLSDSSIPFAPVGSTSEKKLPIIYIGESGEIEFEIAALPNSEGGLYKVPITLEYYDEFGRLTTKTDLIGIKIGGIPDLLINVDSREVYRKGDNGRLVIKIVNRGLTNIKFVSVKLRESKYFNILSGDEVYVSNIDSDDYETADFKINIKGSKNGILILPLTISYLDANNKRESFDRDIEMKVYSSWSAKRLGLVKSNNAMNITIILVIFLLLYLGYRRFRKINKGGFFEYLKYLLFLIKRFLRKIKRIMFRK